MSELQGVVVNERLSDQAFSRIKEIIVQCQLRPGSEVTESRLAELCGLGKAPIRAALARLSEQGLVKPLHRRGYQISPVTLRDVNEIFQARLLLEPSIAEAAAGVSHYTANLKELRDSIQASLKRGVKKNEFIVLDRTVRLGIAQMTGNERVVALLSALLDEVERFFHIGLSSNDSINRLLTNHDTLLDAIEKHETVRARELSMEDLKISREMFVDLVLSASSLLDVNIADLDTRALHPKIEAA